MPNRNLLTGITCDGYSGRFLIRVKGACNKFDWDMWPELIEEAMQATVTTYGNPISYKSRVKYQVPLEHACMTRCR